MNDIFLKILKNTSFNLAGRVFIMAVNILIIPFMIQRIGLRAYGMWVVLYAFMNYFVLLDMGVSSSYERFIAEEKAKNNKSALNSIITLGMLVNIVIASIFFAVGLLAKEAFISHFLRGINNEDIGLFYSLALGVFIISYIFNIFQSVIGGFQRMELINAALITSKITETLLIIILLLLGYGVFGVILAVSFGRMVYVLMILVMSKYVFPEMAISLKGFDIAYLKNILAFAWKVQVTNISMWINMNLDKFLISFFINLNMVAFYDFAQKISGAFRNISISLIGPVIPASSEVNISLGAGALEKFFYRSMKMLIFSAVPLFFVLLINARGIIWVWLGEGYSVAAITMIILLIGTFFNVMTGAGTSIARGINKPIIETKYTLIYLAINLFLSVALIIKFGYYGAASGTALAYVISSIYFFIIFMRQIKMPADEFLRKILYKPMMVSLLGTAIVFLLDRVVFLHGFHAVSRMWLGALIFIKSLFFVCIFYISLFKMKYFTISGAGGILRKTSG